MSEHPTRYDAPLFGGKTFDEELDSARLTKNLEKIRDYMLSHEGFRTPSEIRRWLNLPPETEITARLRDLRKPKFGAYEVTARRRWLGGGVYEYRVRRSGQ
jgi:hypothetical protein